MPSIPTRRFSTAPETIVAMRPDAKLTVSHEALTANTDFDVTNLAKLIAAPDRTLTPLFGLSEERLRFKTSELARTSAGDVPNLSVLYRLQAPAEQLPELIGRLRAEDVVETVYQKPGVVPALWSGEMMPNPESPPSIPLNFTPSQRYLDPAPGGVDARHAWTHDGGRGTSIRIIDVEGAWRFSHEDLREHQGGIVGGVPIEDQLWRNHGTAVIGVFSGDENGVGVTGICPQATVSGVSVFGNQPGWGTAAAIFLAADKLNPGDILLIELQAPGPTTNFQERDLQEGYIPIEWWPDCLKAIQYATQRGILVVSAGGNGNQNLDAEVYNISPKPPYGPFPSDWRNPFNRNSIDSLSIMVGAGIPPLFQGETSGPDRARLSFSNYGSIFDAQGWGELVTTCGFGNAPNGGGPDEDLWFTRTFNGTSSAAPMIAGALGCVQGILKHKGLPLLTPAQARQILRDTGSPQADLTASPASNRIGNRPDLRQMIARVLPPPNPIPNRTGGN